MTTIYEIWQKNFFKALIRRWSNRSRTKYWKLCDWNERIGLQIIDIPFKFARLKSSRIERLYNTIHDWKVIPLYLINTCSVNNLRFYPNLKVSSRICLLERIFFIAQRNRNFTIVPKLTFVILKRNTKFYNRTETVICIFTRKYEVYCCTRTATFFTTKYNI